MCKTIGYFFTLQLINSMILFIEVGIQERKILLSTKKKGRFKNKKSNQDFDQEFPPQYMHRFTFHIHWFKYLFYFDLLQVNNFFLTISKLLTLISFTANDEHTNWRNVSRHNNIKSIYI